MFADIRNTLERIAIKHKLDDFELNLSLADTTSFRIEQRDLTLSSQVGVATLGMRLLKKGKLTYASSTVFDEQALERVVEAGLTNLQPTKLDGFKIIPQGLSADEADSEVERLVEKPKVLRDLLSAMVRQTWEKGKGKFSRLNGNGSVSSGESWVYTAHSPEPAYHKGTAFSTFVDLDSRDFEFLVGKKMPSEKKIASLGSKLARRLPKKTMKPGDLGVKGKEVEVIIHPMCLQSLFSTLIAEHIYASNKLSGLSRFEQGKELAAKHLVITDDATHPQLLTSTPTDDEGTPSQRNVLFAKGKFKSFLYDAETAVADNAESTGNGMRRPVLAEDHHEAPIRPTLRGLVMEPGKTKLSEMIRSVKKGVHLKYLLGLHTADRVTGSFSNTAYVSYVIQNGKLSATCEPGTWAVRGNALKLLNGITQVSAERLNLGSALLPWVKTRLHVG